MFVGNISIKKEISLIRFLQAETHKPSQEESKGGKRALPFTPFSHSPLTLGLGSKEPCSELLSLPLSVSSTMERVGSPKGAGGCKGTI